MIAIPRLTLLDSSTLAHLADDAYSKTSGLRDSTQETLATLYAAGHVPVLLYEHLVELLRYEDAHVVERRLRFFVSLAHVAWVRGVRAPEVIGGTTDVFFREVLEAKRSSASGAKRIASTVREQLYEFGSGFDAVELFVSLWMSPHRTHLVDRLRDMRSKTIALESICNFSASTTTERWRSNPESLQFVEDPDRTAKHVAQDMQEWLSSHADPCLADPADLSRRHAMDAAALVNAAKSRRTAPIDTLASELGLDPGEVRKCKSPRDVGRLAGYTERLRYASQQLQIEPPLQPSDIPSDRLPSRVIFDSVAERQWQAHRARGSDFNDRLFASMAPYVDILEVDKRSAEYVRQIRRGSKMQDLVRAVVIRTGNRRRLRAKLLDAISKCGHANP